MPVGNGRFDVWNDSEPVQIIAPLFAALTSAAWLVPNHYMPWLAAWNEGFMIACLLMLAMAVNGAGSTGFSWRLPSVAAICAATVLMQYAFGKIIFFGDAVTVLLYVGIWFAAVLTGRAMANSSTHTQLLNALAAGWCLAAVLSVGVAMAQWTGSLNLNIYAVDLPPGGRPFANVGQPNHFSTLCFVGLCGVLWLYESQRIRGPVFLLVASVLLVGMVASQSRTGWLQVGMLVAWGLVTRGRAALRISKMYLLSVGVMFVAWLISWPWFCDVLLLSAGRAFSDQMQAGVRLPYWWSMLDAIGRQPLFGYGWTQAGTAQLRVALDHPPMGALFDHSHNVFLDLVLWMGLPVGGLVVAILISWFVVHFRACRDARMVWFLAVAGGVFLHGMLEYPLAYAYFLIPVGLAMGIVEAPSSAGKLILRLPNWGLPLFAVLLGALFLTIAVDYLKVEERFRSLRFELANIGVVRQKPRLEKHVLTQLEALMLFYQTEAKPGMQPEQLEWMHDVSARYAYPPVLLRYALATGLNGQPEVAHETLALICRIHLPKRCKEARDSWESLQGRYPQLSQIMLPAASQD